jgi:hypothetical protein
MTTTPRSSTATLIKALAIMAKEDRSEDGIAGAALLEASQRLGEMALALGYARDEPGLSSADQMRRELTARINS